jgi:MFS family permease
VTLPDTAASLPTPLLSPRYRWATIGMVSLIFLAAFEALAVTTIMPTVSADLDGRAWFSAAFSVTLAASVVGMVAGGMWADRSGPNLPLLASVGGFSLGLLLAGLAPSIELFVAARFLQGLGTGAMTVALYVLVARHYAPVDHPGIFGAFAAAWVVPSMVGPTVAGVVAEATSWRWVFLGVVALSLAATAAMLPVLRAAVEPPDAGRAPSRGRLALSAVVALAVVGLDLAGRSRGALGYAAAVVSLAVVLVAVRPLLPAGTLVVRRGLPAVVALRGAIAATFFATEIYLPYLLQEHYDVPAWLSGATLTVGALGWAGASQLFAGIGSELAATALHLSAWLVGVAWVLAGAGMGLMFPRISAYVLAASGAHEQGGNSAAMSIADAVGGATAISLAGLLFTAVGTAADLAPFVAALAFTTVLAGGAVLVARRTSTAPVSRPVATTR